MSVYALWNNKGGVGKSYLTFQIACEYARTQPQQKNFGDRSVPSSQRFEHAVRRQNIAPYLTGTSLRMKGTSTATRRVPLNSSLKTVPFFSVGRKTIEKLDRWLFPRN